MKKNSILILLLTLISFSTSNNTFAAIQNTTNCENTTFPFICNFFSGNKTKTSPSSNIQTAQLKQRETLTDETPTKPTEDGALKKLTDDLTKTNEQKELMKKEVDKQAQELKKSEVAIAHAEDNEEFNKRMEAFKKNPPQLIPENILNQVPPQFDGKFSCDKKGGGTLSGGPRDKPKSQGGPINDELFYAVSKAAEASGANIQIISGFRPGATIAGSNRPSHHGFGNALDIIPKGSKGEVDNDPKNVAFMVYFLANTANFNTVGSYPDRKWDHSHLGRDGFGTWSQYRKSPGGKIEPWKDLAFRAVYAKDENKKPYTPEDRPAKEWINKLAKEAAKDLCGK